MAETKAAIRPVTWTTFLDGGRAPAGYPRVTRGGETPLPPSSGTGHPDGAESQQDAAPRDPRARCGVQPHHGYGRWIRQSPGRAPHPRPAAVEQTDTPAPAEGAEETGRRRRWLWARPPVSGLLAITMAAM